MKPQFFKASFSEVPRKNPKCVMCRLQKNRVEVIHSQDPTKRVAFTKAEWSAFVKGVKACEFDL